MQSNFFLSTYTKKRRKISQFSAHFCFFCIKIVLFLVYNITNGDILRCQLLQVGTEFRIGSTLFHLE